MPPDHQKYVQWNGERFRSWAAKIGESTAAVIHSLLESRKVEQQSYKSCMALLKLCDKYSPQRLESACTKALGYTPQPSLKNIQAILQTGQDRISDEPPCQNPASSEYCITRGAGYYSGRDREC